MNNFEKAIKEYLDQRAAQDEQFAVTYAKEGKSIEECCKYINGEVSKLIENGESCVPMQDADVYGMAVHYYDEDNIEITPVNANVSVGAPHNGATYEPTEEDKEAAKQAALRRLEQEVFDKMHAPKKRKQEEKSDSQYVQASLF